MYVLQSLLSAFTYQTTDDRKIRALEERNESQNDQIDAMEEDKERFYKEMVASRSTKACLDSVDSQLGRFSAQLRALDTSQDTAAIELLNMKTKFVLSSFSLSERNVLKLY